jgi:hypothetical protein
VYVGKLFNAIDLSSGRAMNNWSHCVEVGNEPERISLDNCVNYEGRFSYRQI